MPRLPLLTGGQLRLPLMFPERTLQASHGKDWEKVWWGVCVCSHRKDQEKVCVCVCVLMGVIRRCVCVCVCVHSQE